MKWLTLSNKATYKKSSQGTFRHWTQSMGSLAKPRTVSDPKHPFQWSLATQWHVEHLHQEQPVWRMTARDPPMPFSKPQWPYAVHCCLETCPKDLAESKVSDGATAKSQEKVPAAQIEAELWEAPLDCCPICCTLSLQCSMRCPSGFPWSNRGSAQALTGCGNVSQQLPSRTQRTWPVKVTKFKNSAIIIKRVTVKHIINRVKHHLRLIVQFLLSLYCLHWLTELYFLSKR